MISTPLRSVLALLTLSVSVGIARAGNTAVTVDITHRFQTIEGFGTALASDTPTWTPQLQNLYAQDLGASILRVALRPDLLPQQVTLGPDLQSNINLMNFNSREEHNWGTFAATINQNKIDQFKVIGTVFSPPPWMKTNNDINGGGRLIQTPDNLQQFARYLAAYAKGFQQNYGVPLYGLSIQNELRFVEAYPSAVYSPSDYAATVKAVGREFAAQGITTKLFGPEDVGADSGFLTDNQMSFINAVNADPETKNYLSFYAIHGYSGNGVNVSSSRTNWADYYNRIKADGKESWQTETSGENPAWLHTDSHGNQDGALSLALHIHEGLSYGNFNSWNYWQFDDGNPLNNYTLIGNNDTTSLKYNVAKHYFRYIRPGAVRVAVTPDVAAGVNVDAFVDDARHVLTMNFINMAATDQTVTLTVPGTDYANFHVYRTSATEPWAVLPDISVVDGLLSFIMPAQSVVTLDSFGIAGIGGVTVPEPATCLLLLPAAWLFAARRPSRHVRA